MRWRKTWVSGAAALLALSVTAGTAAATVPEGSERPGSFVATVDVEPSPEPSPTPSDPPTPEPPVDVQPAPQPAPSRDDTSTHGGEGQDVRPGEDNTGRPDAPVLDPDSVPVLALPEPDPEAIRLANLAADRVKAIQEGIEVLDERAQQAVAEANSAEAAVARALDLASETKALADAAQRRVEVTAAEMYMSGGGSELQNLVTAVTTASNVTDLQRNVVIVDSIARDRVVMAQNAEETAQVAVGAQQAAAQAQVVADAAVVKVQDTKAAMIKRLKDAQAALSLARVKASSSGLVSAQTVVGPDGCPTAVPSGTLRGGAESVGVAKLCRDSVRQAATPQAALAIQYAFRMLGAPYACEGVGRNEPFRFDCSSLLSRAYAEGAGLGTAGRDWAPSTRDMAPWDGVKLSEWYMPISEKGARPGDLVLFHTPDPDSEHVVMLLADGFMLHTNSCGDVAHVTVFPGMSDVIGDELLGVRRVNPSP